MPPKKKSTRKKKLSWQAIVQEAQDYRESTLLQLSPPAADVPKELLKNVIDVPRSLLDPTYVSITELPLKDLVTALQSGNFTATAATTAFLHRAVVSHRLANCLTELLATRALDRAKDLDAYFQQHGKPIGPLHGLPISIKEHLGLKGLRYTTGYVSHWENVAQEDAHLLQILHAAGAVFHARTTIPQTMMHLETDSNLYGVTTNPYNKNLTSGGSSGGEAALISLRGSGLGIGSDVGGSIRNPASHCGIWGLKPTAFRVPTDGWGYMMAGADHVESVLGPMSTSLFGLELVMKTVISAEPWRTEPALIPLPWRDVQLPEKIRIGVLWHDGIVLPHPPVTRALRMIVDRIQATNMTSSQEKEKRGQTDAVVDIGIVPFPPHAHDEAWAILSSLYYPDGGAFDTEAIDSTGEPWRPLSSFIIKENPSVKKLDVGELTYWLEEREAYRKEYALHWGNLGVDAVLCPAAPGAAPRHGGAASRYWGYTSVWNCLDYPGVVVPVTKVDRDVDMGKDVVARREFLSGHDEDVWKSYDLEETHGCPVGVQVVGRRFEDEKVLAIAGLLEERLGLPFSAFP